MKTFTHQPFGRYSVKVTHPRRVNNQYGGFTTVYDPETLETVYLFIDIQSIVNQIGVRAIRSKSGKAKYMHGAILVKREAKS